MPLPIALGGKSISSQDISGPTTLYNHWDQSIAVPRSVHVNGSGASNDDSQSKRKKNNTENDESEDSHKLEPLELYQTLAWGICPHKEWLVRVTCSYYDLIVPTTGSRETTMVEIRIQVSYLTRPFSPNYRETTHHLRLFDGAQDHYPQSQPQVVVSEDRRNVAVLLFHPHQQSSAVVTFQLRKPRSDITAPSTYSYTASYLSPSSSKAKANERNNKSKVPLPSYCSITPNDSNASSVFSRDAPAVATHPKFVSVWGISAICSLPNVSPPVLLAACHDGSLVWLDFRSALAVATGRIPVQKVATDSVPVTSENSAAATTGSATTAGNGNDKSTENDSTAGGQAPSSANTASTNGTASNPNPHLPFSSIAVSPSSGMDQGTILAISARGGHCLLGKWTLESTSLVEETFVKRASTGTVVVEASASEDDSPATQLRKVAKELRNNRQHRGRRHRGKSARKPPDRASSANDLPEMKGTLQRMFGVSKRSSQNAVNSPTKTRNNNNNSTHSQKSGPFSPSRMFSRQQPDTNMDSSISGGSLPELRQPQRSSFWGHQSVSTASLNSSISSATFTNSSHGFFRGLSHSSHGLFSQLNNSIHSGSSIHGSKHGGASVASQTTLLTTPETAQTPQSPLPPPPLMTREEQEALKLKEHMSKFVLTELQKQKTTSTITQDVSTPNRNSRKNLLRRRRSDIAAHITDSSLADNDNKNGNKNIQMVGNTTTSLSEIKRKSMTFEILSILSDDNLVDAQFSNLSTVVCVLYQANKGGKQQRSAHDTDYDGSDETTDNSAETKQSPTTYNNNMNRLAQVYCISELGTFQPMVSLQLASDQVMGDDDCYDDEGDGNDTNNDATQDNIPTTNSLQSHYGIEYDPISDAFALTTKYHHQWLACLWNWRSNVLGWKTYKRDFFNHHKGNFNNFADTASMSFSSSLWSRLYFGQHAKHGSHLTLLEACQPPASSKIQTRKEVVGKGLLSPPHSLGGSTTILESCNILLANDSVSFPDVSQHTTPHIRELEWRVSTFPLSYLNAYGPPSIAAIGRDQGKSLAIASSAGVCTLDINKCKWKQFGTPTEEAMFQVIAMTWWEGNVDMKNYYHPMDIHEGDVEDLLVAIIQCNHGQQYLSCWSHRRLDLAHQLLEPVGPRTKSFDDASPLIDYCWGIPLSQSVKATSISLLAEPMGEPSREDEEKGRKQPRRAVVVVSSTNAETCEMDYASYQLQVVSHDNVELAPPAETYMQQKPYVVFAAAAVLGSFKNGTRSVGPISSTFLAGASFRFDLEDEMDLKSPVEEFVLTLGVVRSSGGIEALCLSYNGRSWFSPVVDADEVSKLWLSDVVCWSRLYDKKKVTLIPVDSFNWVIELLNGELYCWSVPFLAESGCDDGEALQPRDMYDLAFLVGEASKGEVVSKPKGLAPPSMVCKRPNRETKRRYLLGTLTHIGSSSDWMQQSSYGCRVDTNLGSVPQSSFGCILRAGQSSKRLYRPATGDIDTDLFAKDFMCSEVYKSSEFTMTPPAFLPSLYTMFVEAAYIRSRVVEMLGEESRVGSSLQRLEAERSRLTTIEGHIQYRLLTSPNEDAVMMALRLLILRSVEMLEDAKKRHSQELSEKSEAAVILTLALFAEVVDAVRRCTTNLQFASLFLGAGRQVEPSSLNHLFPLPMPAETLRKSGVARAGALSGKGLNRTNALSVIELFSLCIDKGSLAASASALPLLGSRIQSRNYCDLLLAQAMDSFVKNMDSSEAKFDRTEEERKVIGDIFRFGIKLEDAARLEDLERRQIGRQEADSKDGAFPFLQDHDDDDRRLSLAGGGDPQEKHSSRTLICAMGGRQSSILNYIVPSMFSGDGTEEEAIKRAAASFIDSNAANVPALDFISPDESAERDNGDATKKVDDGLKSVGGLMAEVITSLLRAPKNDCPWKTMSSLARLVVRGCQTSSVLANESFIRVAASAQLSSFEEIIPPGYDLEGMDNVVKFVVVQMGKCTTENDSHEAGLTLDLTMTLLQRLDDFPLPKANHSLVTSSLLLVILIAGHVSARLGILLSDLDEDSLLVSMYDKVMDSFVETTLRK